METEFAVRLDINWRMRGIEKVNWCHVRQYTLGRTEKMQTFTLSILTIEKGWLHHTGLEPMSTSIAFVGRCRHNLLFHHIPIGSSDPAQSSESPRHWSSSGTSPSQETRQVETSVQSRYGAKHLPFFLPIRIRFALLQPRFNSFCTIDIPSRHYYYYVKHHWNITKNTNAKLVLLFLTS